ncbi:MAG TPA: urease accessory protein UreE [Desulfobulbus sp.]|nr:urease accessory protein UreE [Desulfobulbus sp.]
MLCLTRKVENGEREDATLTMTRRQRTRSRLRVTLDTGEEAGLFLPRGTVLRPGDLLASDDGVLVRVRGATEAVSRVVSDDPLLLARACYHLGNRHAEVQILRGEIRYLRDHVLDRMLEGLGLRVTASEQPFEPEGGAYVPHGRHG